MAGDELTATDDVEEGSTLDEAERKELQNPGYELFIAALSILSIVNIVLVSLIDAQDLQYVLIVMNGLLSGILFLDFCVRLKSAESRTDYFFRKFGWADLLASVPLAQLKILRVFRLIRVYRLLREYGARNVLRSLRKQRAGSALLLLLFVAILVLEFGSLLMLRIEAGAPDGNIKTASDALWYTIVTISTVGYGDQYPVTNPGRILGTFIIVLGVGIFGTLTGYLANLFLGPSSEEAPAPEPAATTDDADAAAQPADPVDLRLARLDRVGRLRDSGVLTAEEFEREMAEILGG
jgi:voltage-gated potassium channel